MKINGTILVVALGLATTALSAHASTSFDGARMITQPDAKHTKSVKGVLTLDEAEHRLSFADKSQSTNVAYSQINSMQVEQTVERLHVPFTGRIQHEEFLTLTYQGSDGRPSYAVFQLKDRSYRDVVAALQAQTGKSVEWISK